MPRRKKSEKIEKKRQRRQIKGQIRKSCKICNNEIIDADINVCATKNVATTVHGLISGCKEYNHKCKTEKSVYLVFDLKCQYMLLQIQLKWIKIH